MLAIRWFLVSTAEHAIVCTGVTRTFGNVPVLRDVDIVVPPGEHLCVQGVSGSGKSTLLHLLGLMDTPTSGTYRLFGHDTASLSAKQRAMVRSRLFGFVFQQFHLMPARTVAENVRLGLLYARSDSGTWSDRIDEVLDFVGMTHRRDARAATLSGGEQQRVAIARGIASHPRVLLCDEPTGNLDTRTAADVLKVLTTLNDAGMTLIVVTHDATVARLADNRIYMVDGQIGTPRDNS